MYIKYISFRTSSFPYFSYVKSFHWRKKLKEKHFYHRSGFRPAFAGFLDEEDEEYFEEYWLEGCRYRLLSNGLSDYDLFIEDHRDDYNPTIIRKNGTKEWFKLGMRHRFNGPALIYPNGDYEYFHMGKRHRINGPAVVYGNKQYWFVEGEFLKCIV
jgi:hypothetical protein